MAGETGYTCCEGQVSRVNSRGTVLLSCFAKSDRIAKLSKSREDGSRTGTGVGTESLGSIEGDQKSELGFQIFFHWCKDDLFRKLT